MGKRGFVLSMDLMLALGVVLIMFFMLTDLAVYQWSKYGYASDAVSVLQHMGVSSNEVVMESRLKRILPFESYNFTLVDFGSLSPINLCSNDTDCSAPHSNCIFYVCGDYVMNNQTGEYYKYSTNPGRYCSSQMIAEGACKPEGDLSQRIYVEMGDDDLVDNFYILRLEVAE